MADSSYQKININDTDQETKDIKLIDNGDGTYSISTVLSTSGEQKQIFFERLTDGSSENMAVDGSVTPVIFHIQPPEGEVWRIDGWIIYVEDGGSFDAQKWGNNITITNGFMPRLKRGNNEAVDLLSFGLKSSGDLASISDEFKHLDFGSGNQFVIAKWDFIKTGQYLRLTSDDRLEIVVRDDLTNLVSQFSHIQGYKE
jgi:hypothetical protein